METKTARLELVLPPKLKAAAIKKAKIERRKLSDYIRILIEKDIAVRSVK
jgi:hypothetical protein